MPLSTPEPYQGTLLPCSEILWNRGEVGTNVPAFTASLATDTEIGAFASTCQASHVLGLVIRHRDDCEQSNIETCFRLLEAERLHQSLASLNAHLIQGLADSTHVCKNTTVIAASLCYAARLILYNVYACNEHY